MIRNSFPQVFWVAVFAFTLICFSDCSAKKKQKNAEGDYRSALAEFAEGSYSQALRSFEDIEQQYPEYHFNYRVITMQAFISYILKQYDKTVVIVDAFAELYPAHRNLPYLLYLRAMAKFKKIKSPLKHYGVVLESKGNFEELLTKYPNTIYKEDSQERIVQLDDMIALYEYKVGEFHRSRNEYFAAIRRYYTVLHLPRNRYQMQSLRSLQHCYSKLGLCHEAKRYKTIYNQSASKIIYDIKE